MPLRGVSFLLIAILLAAPLLHGRRGHPLCRHERPSSIQAAGVVILSTHISIPQPGSPSIPGLAGRSPAVRSNWASRRPGRGSPAIFPFRELLPFPGGRWRRPGNPPIRSHARSSSLFAVDPANPRPAGPASVLRPSAPRRDSRQGSQDLRTCPCPGGRSAARPLLAEFLLDRARVRSCVGLLTA